MSIDRCERCTVCLDTDEEPHVYREKFDDTCLCDMCYGTECKAHIEQLAKYTDQELADELTRRCSTDASKSN